MSFRSKRKVKKGFLIFENSSKDKIGFGKKRKKSMESQRRLMSWYWKQKLTWRKELITYNRHQWIMASFNWLVIFWRGRGWWQWRFDWNRTYKVNGVGKFWTYLDKEDGWFSKLDHFHGRHMCIVPNAFHYHFMF